jgi:cell division protein FtsL
MYVGKPARAIAVAPSFTWPQVDLRRWGVRTLLFSFCLVSALLLTASRLEITRMRYQLSTLDHQRQTLLADVARLEVESASLAAPRRIESLAKGMGFVQPDRDTVAVLDE